MTVFKEINSKMRAALSAALTLATAFLVTFATASTARLLGWM